MKRLRSNGGFTLIELLIVIIIIGILAAIAIPMFLNQRNKAKDAAVKEGVHALQVAIQSYAVDNLDMYPTVAYVVPLATNADGLANATTGYLDKWPNDAFHNTTMGPATVAIVTTAAHAVASNGQYTYAGVGTANTDGEFPGYSLLGGLSNGLVFNAP